MIYKYIPHNIYQKFKKEFNSKKVKFIYDKDNFLLTVKIKEPIWLTAFTVSYQYTNKGNTILIDSDWDDFDFWTNKIKNGLIEDITNYINEISDVCVYTI